jgi:hypothetical protein
VHAVPEVCPVGLVAPAPRANTVRAAEAVAVFAVADLTRVQLLEVLDANAGIPLH